MNTDSRKHIAHSAKMCFPSRMRKQATLPVRLETDQKEGIERIGADLGLSPSAIIRLLVKSLCELSDRNKGKVEFPLKLKQ
jgi:hypothetical protein